MNSTETNWLLNLPCVINREVIVDVRGPNPVVSFGLIAQTIREKNEVVDFVIQNVGLNRDRGW